MDTDSVDAAAASFSSATFSQPNTNSRLSRRRLRRSSGRLSSFGVSKCRLRRRRSRSSSNANLAQHDSEPETTLLAKSVRAFGERRVTRLRSPEIGARGMTIAPGHRFEATQALRQVLGRAIDWGML